MEGHAKKPHGKGVKVEQVSASSGEIRNIFSLTPPTIGKVSGKVRKKWMNRVVLLKNLYT